LVEVIDNQVMTWLPVRSGTAMGSGLIAYGMMTALVANELEY
jgi:hypothetical protein